MRHFRDALAGTRTKLVYFDGDDDLNVQWPSVLSLVDLYVKKHVYANEAAYAAHYIGKSNLTDYAARQYGASFDNDIIPRSGGVAAELLGKLHLGWNIALDDKLFELSQQVPTFPAPPRDIDVSCRAYVAETMWLHPLRKAALERMEAMAGRYKVLAPRDRVPQDKYYEEMLRSKICVSPFGYGELCWRDFEAILCGCLLVKPDMGHVKTEPNLFVPGETYVPVRWDYLDLEERCAPYLADESARLAIAERARSRLLTSLEPEWFSDRFSALSRRIDLVPA